MAVSGHHGTGAITDAAPHGDLATHHPGDREYVRIAVILTLITIAEVAIYYIEGVRGILVPVLIVMSIAKFATVVGYFMHLKFDDRRFMLLFGAGLAISLAVVTALAIMFWTGSFVPDAPPAVAVTAH